MPQIMFRGLYLSHRKRWVWRWVWTIMLVAMVSLICVVFMYQQTQAQMRYGMDTPLQDRYSEYKTREDIYKILRDNKMNLAQGMEIAEAIIVQSKRTEIPVKMFLALMRTESNFTVRAVSNNRAMGIMQIHPITWRKYTKKLNLSSSREEAFRPSVNIMVSASILKDLHDKYQRMGYQEPQLWDHVLSAYYAGEGSVRSGLNRHDLRYVHKVRTYVNEYGQRLSMVL
ncbi:MAG: lytic transglycosylase domain-containing protein [Syntrophales bacterium]